MPASIRDTTSAASSSTSYTCARPTGVIAGDMMLAFQAADVGALSNMGTPTGGATWVLLASRTWSGGAGVKVWWKLAGGSEPSTYGFTHGSGADGITAIAAIDGSAGVEPLSAQAGVNTGTSSVATPSINPSGGNDLELRWVSGAGTGGAASWTTPATYSEHEDVQSGEFTTGCLASKQLTSDSATGTQNFTSSTSLPYSIGFTVAVSSLGFHTRLVASVAAVHRASSW